jgi:hypothetical protein
MGRLLKEMLGDYMRPLANRLWDTTKADDIKTLDWMQRVTCIARDHVKPRIEEAKNESRRHRAEVRNAKFVRDNIQAEKRSNQWGVTKGKGAARYGRRVK